MHLEDNLIRVSVAATRRIGDAMDGAGNRRSSSEHLLQHRRQFSNDAVALGGIL